MLVLERIKKINLLNLYKRLPFSSDGKKILAPYDDKEVRKWIKTLEYNLQASSVEPTIPQILQTAVSDSVAFKKPTKLSKVENKNDFEENFATSITKSEDVLHGQQNQNENKTTSNYKNNSDSQLINVENFDRDILLAIGFEQTRIKYAKEPFFNNNLKLNLARSDKDSTTKSTNVYEKETIENEINKLDVNINSHGAGAGASLKLSGFDVGGGVNYANKKGNEIVTSSRNDKIKLSNKENILYTLYTGKFTMPPKADSLTTNRILSGVALADLNSVKNLRTARAYVEEYGSHYLETTYQLGGYYAEEIDASLDNKSEQSQDDNSLNNTTNFTADMKLSPLAKANATYGNTLDKSSVINTSSAIRTTNTSANKISSAGSASTSKDFHEKLYQNIYESKVMDSNRESKLEASRTGVKDQKEFKRLLTPIWKYLCNCEEASPTQDRIVFMIKIMCKYFENLFFFRLDFEICFSSLCNDVELVGKYLDSLESYLFKRVEDQLDGNQINDDNIDEKLAAIFSAESNQNFGLHQKLLEKLEKNKIIFVDKHGFIAKLIKEHPNKCLFIAFYNQKFQADNSEEWHKIIDKLIALKSSSINKCAVFDCDLHSEKKFDENYIGKVYRWVNGGLQEEISTLQVNHAENSNSRYYLFFIKFCFGFPQYYKNMHKKLVFPLFLIYLNRTI
jgi:hypothetical protein